VNVIKHPNHQGHDVILPDREDAKYVRFLLNGLVLHVHAVDIG
jgi:hypothetical protein